VPGNPDQPRRTAVRLSDDDGAFAIVEAEVNLTDARLFIGGWRYTATFEAIDGSERCGNNGLYPRGETVIVGCDAPGGMSLNGFARLGISEGAINPFNRFGHLEKPLAFEASA
jgi:porin